jgi:hypothetical protein
MGSSESKAKCSFGQKEFYVSNMGEAALKIHKNLKLKKSTEHSGFSNKINHHPILK